MIATAEQIAAATQQDFQRLVELMNQFSVASNALKLLEATVNESQMKIVTTHSKEYADLQLSLAEAEKSLKTISQDHPEWFGKKKSIKTPFGTVKFTRSTKLVVKNKEVTLARLDVKKAKDEKFDRSRFVRSEEALNLEAFEALDDKELAYYGIERQPEENFSVTPVELDMGKAVKEATAANAEEAK